MLAPQAGAHAVQNDVGHARLNDRIPPIHRASAPFSFQPAFVLDDGLHIGNLGSNDFCIAHNTLLLIRNGMTRGFRSSERIDDPWQNQPMVLLRIPASMKKLFLALGLAALGIGLEALIRGRARRKRIATQSGPSYDEIALRAYFIGLDREARGEPGAPLEDWTEAEHQLSSQTQCAAPASAMALTR